MKNSTKPNPYNIPYFWSNTHKRDYEGKDLLESCAVHVAFASILLIPVTLRVYGVDASAASVLYGFMVGIAIWIYLLQKRLRKTRLYYASSQYFKQGQRRIRDKYPFEVMRCKLEQKECELAALQEPKKARKLQSKIARLEKEITKLEIKTEKAKIRTAKWVIKLKQGIRRAEETNRVGRIDPKRHNLALQPGFEWAANPNTISPRVVRYQQHIDDIQQQIDNLKKGRYHAA
jgi:hypothetical protein